MRPLSSIVRSIEAAMEAANGHALASAVQEVMPMLKSLTRQDSAPAQVCLDVMFAALSRAHAGEAPKGREECMEWARSALRERGIDVVPMGLSHAVIREHS